MRFRQHERTARQSTLRLLALFALVLVGLLAAVNAVLALIYWATFPFAHDFPSLFFETNTALVLLFVLGGCWVESMRLREGGAHVARLAGGREAQVSSGGELGLLERRFANIVQEMGLASGHSGVPAVWVLPKDDAINAFAAGWSSDDAVIAVTRGALERLTRAELQGVVAHEFSHLVHGDTRLNMRLIGLVWGLQMIWGLGVALWECDELGRRRFGALFGLGLMAVGSLGWAAGRLLQAAVSRQREFLADASAVKYTRLVDGLGGALRKIADQQLHGRATLQSAHAMSLAHLLLAQRGARAGWRALWHTHPPLAERLRRLYGREVLALPAPVLELDADDQEPLMRMAPDASAAAASEAPRPRHPPRPPDPQGGQVAQDERDVTLAGEYRDGDAPQAHHHDALQVPGYFDARAREHEALARIEHWHGPGEWQAAMLALAIPLGLRADTPEGGDAWSAWREACAGLGVADAVQREIGTLGARARRRTFATLLQRACSATPAQRRSLRRQLLQRWSALAPTPATQWRALALGLLLGGAQRSARRGAAAAPLSRHPDAAHAATTLLAAALGAPPDATHAWLNAATQALADVGAAAPRSAAAGLAPATPLRRLHCALRVRRLAPMQRPLLLRAWLGAADAAGLADHAGSGDALHLACLWLDLPVPSDLVDES